MWIQHRLTNRTQRTGGETSLSGIIQSSCIGQLVFVLYINDIANMFNNAIESKLYADDLKLYTEIVVEVDNLILQHGLDDLVSWSNKWQLTTSFKNVCMQVGRSNIIPDPKYSLGDCLLPNLTSHQRPGSYHRQ